MEFEKIQERLLKIVDELEAELGTAEYYQYGEKDSRYLGKRDAAAQLREELTDNNKKIFVRHAFYGEPTLYQPGYIFDYMRKFTKKAKEDYNKAFIDFFDAVRKRADLEHIGE